jgi:hypothetical protein
LRTAASLLPRAAWRSPPGPARDGGRWRFAVRLLNCAHLEAAERSREVARGVAEFLVWKAIASMTPMMSAMRFELAVIAPMVATTWPISSLRSQESVSLG